MYMTLLGVICLSSLRCSNSVEPLFVMDMEADFVIPPGLNSFDTHYFIIRNVPTRIKNYLGSNFDPSMGTQSITYTVGSGSCQQVSTQTITVGTGGNPAWTASANTLDRYPSNERGVATAADRQPTMPRPWRSLFSRKKIFRGEAVS